MRRGALLLLLLASTALVPAGAQTVTPNAQPQGGRVAAGSATISQSATATTINQASNRAVIDWQSFNVGANQAVQFVQPTAQSWTLNRVQAGDPSVIAGRITANGGVAIVNRSGVLFTEGAQVNVGALVASAADIANQDFMAGRMAFTQPAQPNARVENRGSITVAQEGLAVLAGPRVANSGTINARLGRVALQGAEAFTLDLAGDGMLSLDVTQQVRTAPEGGQALVTNTGTILAQGGSIQLSASAASGLVETLVNASGQISAPTAAGNQRGSVAINAQGGGVQVAGTVAARGNRQGRQGGSIAVNATGDVTLAPGAVVDASGKAGGGTVTLGTNAARTQRAQRSTVAQGATIRADALETGDGGTVLLDSLLATGVFGQVSARGGPQGGNGGFVELSSAGALTVPDLNAQVDLRAPAGRAGTLLLDPTYIIIRSAATTGAEEVDATPDGGGIYTADTPGSPTTAIIAPGAITGFNGNVVLSATDGITVQNAIFKTAARSAQPGSLTLLAGSVTVNARVIVDDGISITATTGGIQLGASLVTAANRSVALEAKTDIVQTAGRIFTTTLTANAGGDVLLTSANNGVAVLGASSAGAGNAFTLNVTNPMAVTGAVTARDVTITAGALTVAAGATVDAAGTARLTATNALQVDGGVSGDNLFLTSSAAGITVSGTLQGGSLAATAAGTLAVLAGGSVDMTGTAALSAGGGIALAGPVAGSTVLLVAGTSATAATPGATITQSGSGLITAGQLGLFAGDDAVLALANQVGAVAGRGFGAVQVTSAQPLTVNAGATLTDPAGASVTPAGLHAGGVLTLQAPGITVDAPARGEGGLALGATAGDLLLRARVVNDGAVAMQLSATGAITQTAGSVETGVLTAQAGTDLQLTSATNAVGELLGASAGAANLFALTTTGALSAAGLLTAQDITLSAGSLTVAGTGQLTATRRLSLASAGAMVLEGPVAGATVLLVAGGSATAATAGATITQAGAGLVTAGQLGLFAGDDVVLTLANKVDAVAGRGFGGVQLASANALTVNAGATLLDPAGASVTPNGLRADGAVTLNAPSLTISAPLRGDGGVSLTATTGSIALGADVTAGTGTSLALDAATDITQGAGGIATGLLTAVAGGDVLLTGAANAVGALGASSAGSVNLFSLTTAGTLSVDGLVTARDITLNAGVLTVTAGGTVGATRNASLTADGTLQVDGTVKGSSIALASTSGGIGVTGTLQGGGVTAAAATSLQLGGALTGSSARLNAGTTLDVLAGGSLDVTGTAVLVAGGALSLAGPVTAATVALLTGSGATSGATITQSGAGLVTAGQLAFRGGDDVTLTLANPVDQVFGRGYGSVQFTSARALAVNGGSVVVDALGGTFAAQGVRGATGVALEAPSLTLSAPVTADAGTAALTAAGAIAINAALGAETVLLLAGSGATTGATITQSGTGVITAGQLSFLAGDDLTLTLANQVGAVSGRGFGDVQFTSAQALAVNGGVTLGGATPDGLRADGTLLLTAPSLSLAAPVQVGSGQALTLVADAMEIGARVIAPGGSIALRPLTAGRAITLGAEAGGTLSLTAAELALLGGLGTDGTTSPATLLTIGSAGAGGITLADDVALRDRVALLNLLSGGNVSQAAGAVLDVAALSATAGSVLLGDAAHSVDQLRGITATGALAFRSAGDLLATGADIQAQSVALTLGGDFTLAAGRQIRATQGGVTIAADGTLTTGAGALVSAADAVANAGDISLTSAAFSLADASLRASAALNGRDISLTQTAGDFSFSPVVLAAAPGRDLVLNAGAGALELAGSIGAGRTIHGSAQTGLTVLAGASLNAPNILLEAGGSLGNAGTLHGGTGVTLTAATTLTNTGGITGGGATLSAGTTLSQQGTLDVTGTASLAAGGAIALDGAVTAGTILLSAGTSPTAATAGATITQSGTGLLTADQLSFLSGDDVTLTLANRLLGVSGQGFGTVQLVNALGLTINNGTAVPAPGGALTVPGLRAAGDLAVTAPGLAINSAVTAPNVTLVANTMAIGATVSAPGGTILLHPLTPGRGITLGGSGSGTLELSTASLANLGDAADPTALVQIGDAASGAILLNGAARFRSMPPGGTLEDRAQRLWLFSGDGISQTSSGGLDVAALTLNGTTINLGASPHAVDRLATVNASGQFSLMTGSGLTSADITAASVGLRVGDALGGGFTLEAGRTLTTTGGPAAITAAGTLTTGSGARIVTAGGAGAGDIDLQAVAFSLAAGSLRPGSAAQGGRDVSLTQFSGNLSFDGAALGTTPPGVLSLTANTGSLTLSGVINAGGGIVGVASRDLTVASGAELHAFTVTLQANNGALANHGLVEGTNFARLFARDQLLNDGTVRSTYSVILRSYDADLDNQGTLSGGSLSLQAATTLASSGTVTGSDATLTSGGLMTLSGSITVDGLLQALGTGGVGSSGVLRSAGGDVTLRATGGDITQGAGTIDAAHGLLTLEGGTVSQAGGAILAQTLSGSASLDFLLPGTGNTIRNAGTIVAGRDLTLDAGANALTVGTRLSAGDGRTLLLRADDLTLTTADPLHVAGGTLKVEPHTAGTGLQLGGAAGSATPGRVTLDDAELALLGRPAANRLGTLELGGANAGFITIAGQADFADAATAANPAADLVRLVTTGDITQQAGTRLVAAQLAFAAGGGVLLDPGGAGNRIPVLAASQAGGGVSLRSDAGLLTLAGTLEAGAGQTVRLRVDDLALQAAIAAAGGTLDVAPLTTGRAITLGADGAGTLALNGTELGFIGPATGLATLLFSGGTVTLGGPVSLAGQTLGLTSSGSILGSGAALTTGVVAGSAVGDILLDNAGNQFTAGALSAGAGRALRLRTAGNLLIAGPLSVAGGGMVLASGGVLSQQAGATLTTGTLQVTAAGAMSLGEANGFATLGAVDVGSGVLRGGSYTVAGPLRATGHLALLADGSMAVTPTTLAAGSAALQAGGTLALDGLRATIGTGLLFAAPGGITAGATTQVRPRDAGVLPAVLYDVRQPLYANPLTLAQPDTPGLPAASQPTQVRRPGSQAPGSFGPAYNRPAGSVALALDAGSSPVFLLLDAGSAGGNVVAGRLGVHGVGGTLALTGALGGLEGVGAAVLADITRPIDPLLLQQYRYNGCVLSAVNCVVPPTLQVVPLRPTVPDDVRLLTNRVNLDDITIPNVAETDYQ